MGSEPPPWTIHFYRDAVGREPVREWLEDLEKTNPREHTSVRHQVDLLEEFGVMLEEPYTRQLSGRLRELRPGPWRITYFCDPKRRFVLLTNFRKKSRTTDPKELKRAMKLMDSVLKEMEER